MRERKIEITVAEIKKDIGYIKKALDKGNSNFEKNEAQHEAMMEQITIIAEKKADKDYVNKWLLRLSIGIIATLLAVVAFLLKQFFF